MYSATRQIWTPGGKIKKSLGLMRMFNCKKEEFTIFTFVVLHWIYPPLK